MTKPKKTDTPTAHPTQGAVPPIDRENAETIEATGDVPMPAVENSPNAIFRPQAGIGTVDVMEITLMYLLQLSGSPAQVEPGGLRVQAMSAARVAQLSDSARRHMVQIQQPAPAEDEPKAVAPPTETAH